jgi:hypothetical protein
LTINLVGTCEIVMLRQTGCGMLSARRAGSRLPATLTDSG